MSEYQHKRCLSNSNLTPALVDMIASGSNIDRLWCDFCKKSFPIKEFTLKGASLCSIPVPAKVFDDYCCALFCEPAERLRSYFGKPMVQ